MGEGIYNLFLSGILYSLLSLFTVDRSTVVLTFVLLYRQLFDCCRNLYDTASVDFICSKLFVLSLVFCLFFSILYSSICDFICLCFFGGFSALGNSFIPAGDSIMFTVIPDVTSAGFYLFLS
jgi:hypothetical protein